MAHDLGVSVSYLNLIERDQRPLSAAFLLKLAASYDLDLKSLTAADGNELTDDLVRAFNNPRLADLAVPRAELRELANRSPSIAQALLRLHAALVTGDDTPARTSPLDAVIAMIAAAGNHFQLLDSAAEALADELRLSGPDLNAAVVERLRARHAITVRTLPADVLTNALRRLDLHTRQLQLSESLNAASRGFAAAVQLALIELREPIAETIAAAGITDTLVARAATVHLGKYGASAILMPYSRFLTACDATGYDMELLQARFARNAEQVAHRIATLARPGARGIPFFFVRIDRAGTISKSFAPKHANSGASPVPNSPIGGGGCALWSLHAAFDRPGQILRQLVEMEDGQRYLTLARTVNGTYAPWGAARAEFAIGIGCDARHAAALAWSAGMDVAGPATPIGPGCAACYRTACRQRSLPPAGAPLSFDDRQRGLTPFRFTED